MNHAIKVAVRQDSDLFCARAKALAASLGLPLLSEADAEFWLEYTEAGLMLCKAGDRKGILLDWSAGGIEYRRRQAKGELLVKALGALPKGAAVLDATAGFATDSVLLAIAGFHVTACERNPVVHALQCDAYERLQACDNGILEHLHLRQVDAVAVLREQQFDAVYLDPMFPDRSKSAAVKKPMVYLQALLEADGDDAQLLDAALASARKRVVVKRPLKAPYLAGMKPIGQKRGKAVRFDIYSPSCAS